MASGRCSHFLVASPRKDRRLPPHPPPSSFRRSVGDPKCAPRSIAFSLALPLWGSLMQYHRPRDLLAAGALGNKRDRRGGRWRKRGVVSVTLLGTHMEVTNWPLENHEIRLPDRSKHWVFTPPNCASGSPLSYGDSPGVQLGSENFLPLLAVFSFQISTSHIG